jgi:DNA polymerase (family 10)
MVVTAREIGLEYLGVSDHFRSPVHRDGITLEEARSQRREIAELRRRFPEVDLLQGVEIDADHDGALLLDDDTLGFFDYVIASVPDPVGGGDPLTEQVVAVASDPRVTILGRPVGDFMLRGTNGTLDMERVLQAAASGGTAVEINANPCCDELDWSCCKRAQELGVAMVISPDAHRAARLVDFRHGAELAQDAGLYCSSILNTLSSAELRHYLATRSTPES